ncbi:MAG: cyclic nucleotide-binding domain-containing protein [Candidatus Omnitrophica bacterium]|nr:cyclic nucleotide-binding domain-containing protein [Candidatus Omnitrophota bacterium]
MIPCSTLAWFDTYRPVLKPDITQLISEDSSAFKADSSDFFSEEELFFLNRMDGSHTLHGLSLGHLQEFGTLNFGGLLRLLARLRQAGYLAEPEHPSWGYRGTWAAARALGAVLAQLRPLYQKVWIRNSLENISQEAASGWLKPMSAFLLLALSGLGAFLLWTQVLPQMGRIGLGTGYWFWDLFVVWAAQGLLSLGHARVVGLVGRSRGISPVTLRLRGLPLWPVWSVDRSSPVWQIGGARIASAQWGLACESAAPGYFGALALSLPFGAWRGAIELICLVSVCRTVCHLCPVGPTEATRWWREIVETSNPLQHWFHFLAHLAPWGERRSLHNRERDLLHLGLYTFAWTLLWTGLCASFAQWVRWFGLSGWSHFAWGARVLIAGAYTGVALGLALIGIQLFLPLRSAAQWVHLPRSGKKLGKDSLFVGAGLFVLLFILLHTVPSVHFEGSIPMVLSLISGLCLTRIADGAGRSGEGHGLRFLAFVYAFWSGLLLAGTAAAGQALRLPLIGEWGLSILFACTALYASFTALRILIPGFRAYSAMAMWICSALLAVFFWNAIGMGADSGSLALWALASALTLLGLVVARAPGKYAWSLLSALGGSSLWVLACIPASRMQCPDPVFLSFGLALQCLGFWALLRNSQCITPQCVSLIPGEDSAPNSLERLPHHFSVIVDTLLWTARRLSGSLTQSAISNVLARTQGTDLWIRFGKLHMAYDRRSASLVAAFERLQQISANYLGWNVTRRALESAIEELPWEDREYWRVLLRSRSKSAAKWSRVNALPALPSLTQRTAGARKFLSTHGLPLGHASALASKMLFRRFTKGCVILESDCPPEAWYEVISGELQVKEVSPFGKTRILANLRSGHSLDGQCLRLASQGNPLLVAAENTELLIIPRTAAGLFLRNGSEQIPEGDWTQLLALPLFRSCNAIQIHNLWLRRETLSFGQGEFLIKQDERLMRFFYLLEGSIYLQRNDTEEQDLLEAGDSFGETALLSVRPSAYTAVAAEDSTLYSFRHHDFLDLFPVFCPDSPVPSAHAVEKPVDAVGHGL